MALSQVDVCNLALSRMGGHSISQITSLGEASTEARQCAIKFPSVLRSALRSYPWRFATKEIALARLGEGSIESIFKNNILYQTLQYYQYPEECLQILAINPVYGKKGNFHAVSYDYTVEQLPDGTKVIVSSCPKAILTCTCYTADPGIWDSLFTDAFAWQLASELCLSLGGSAQMVQSLQEMADRAFEKVKSLDCKEGAIASRISYYLEARK